MEIQCDEEVRAAPALYLPSGHSLKIELEALQMNDQRVRQHLDAIPLHCIHLHVHTRTCCRRQGVECQRDAKPRMGSTASNTVQARLTIRSTIAPQVPCGAAQAEYALK
jgi:hypothetical protein